MIIPSTEGGEGVILPYFKDQEAFVVVVIISVKEGRKEGRKEGGLNMGMNESGGPYSFF